MNIQLNTRRSWLFASLALLVLLLFASVQMALAATNIYVRPDGNDTECDGTANVAYPGGSGPLACAVQTVAQGAALVDPGGTVYVAAGTYAIPSNITLNKSNVVIQGAGSNLTKFQVSGTGYRFSITANGVAIQDVEIEKTDKTGVQNIIYIGANNVTIKNNSIHGQYVFGDGDVSRAFEVAYGSANLTIEGNTIYSLRQPGYLNGSLASPTTGSIQNNHVHTTRGWVLAGANMTFTNNTWGSGATTNYYDIVILSGTDASYYPDIVAISNANNQAVIEDQRPSPAVLSIVQVDASAAGGGNGSPTQPYQTITPAVTRVVSGGKIKVAAGMYPETVVISKALNLLCAQAGVPVAGRTAGSATETVIDARGMTDGVIVRASNVTVDGCDILGNSSTYAGVKAYATTGAGSLSNIDILNNFIHGMARPNPNSPAYVTSYGVFGLGDAIGGVRNTLSDLTIQGNKIYNLGGALVSGDTSAGAGVWLYSLAGAGATVTGNTFQDIQNGYDLSGGDVEYGVGVAIMDDGDPVPDAGGLVQGNTYANTFAGAVLFAGTTTFNEAAASFSGVTMYALNAGNLATVNEATLAKYAKSDKPVGFPSSTAYFPSINSAILFSDSGMTVNVSPGTFVEGPQVVINKDVTVTGTDKTTTIIVPSANTSGSGDGRGWFLVQAGKTFNLSKVTLDGIGKNIYQGIRSFGNGVIDDNRLMNIVYPGYNGMGVVLFGNMTVSNNTFTNMGRIGVIAFGTGSTASVISGNSFTGKGAGDWLDYAVELGGGAQATISGNTISDNLGVASSDGSTSAGILVTTYYGAGTAATITGNTFTNNSEGISVGYDASDTSVVVANDNCFSGNDFGVYSTAPSVDAANNWWGDAMGPYNAANNPAGLGDEVSDQVTFTPWLDACHGSPVGGHFRNTTTLEEFVSVQQAVDDPDTLSGHTIVPITAGAFPGSATINKSGVTIDLSGRTFTGGSPAFIINADDVTIQNGILDGWTGSANNSSPAIQVQAGADNFSLLNCEVLRWMDGVELLGPVTSFKMVGNWFHDNSESGLQVNSSASIGGVLTIEGNLFKENTGPGIQNDNGALLKAEYNSWGAYGGPTAGDGVSSDVDYEPWVFIEPYMDVDPDTNASLRTVAEGQTFTVKLKVDAQNLYGLVFRLVYDPARLTLISGPTFEGDWAGKCVDLGSSVGVFSYRCNLVYPTAEFTALGGTIASFSFTTNVGSLPGTGPWDTYFDISAVPAQTSAAAVGGVKIWVNNAGYGAPSTAVRDITDSNDGQITINGAANYTGFVDLQGRTNDSGALIQVYDSANKAGSVLLASATSAAGGGYTTAYLPSRFLTIGSTYYLFVDRPLFLPTTVMMTDPFLSPRPPIPTDWKDSKLLSTRPLTPLALVFLLGGDGTDDDLIDINDASCIGSAYGTNTNTCTGGAGANSDVNGDGTVNINDLTLMGGNFTLNTSPWMP